MAETPSTPTKEEASCCSSGHDGHGCCGTKALLVLTFVLLSGIIGYLMGSRGSHHRHGWRHHGCGYPMAMVTTMPDKAASK